MAHLTGAARAHYVQRMFGRIARRYDLMNRLITGGQDLRWRKIVVDFAAPPEGGCLLDLGTGTGDIAAEALRRDPTLLAAGGDFTLEMMRVGRARPGRRAILWAATDALNLPFPDEAFDAVTSGFLMRNVSDARRAFDEQRRVLRSGGRVVCLDTTPPPHNWLHPLIAFHLHTVIPTLGRLLTGSAEAYTYLPDSTEGFLTAEALAGCMAEAGFREVHYRRLMFRTIAIHVGVR
jgi:demethylmenaquinone methyltransferase/2-methoxy-6-polyprenyl-1,4-benzoquinol methylase